MPPVALPGIKRVNRPWLFSYGNLCEYSRPEERGAGVFATRFQGDTPCRRRLVFSCTLTIEGPPDSRGRRNRGVAVMEKMKQASSQERSQRLTLRANAPKTNASRRPSCIRHRVSRCPHLAAGGMFGSRCQLLYLKAAAQLPSLETMQGPTGLEGVQRDPNSGHSGGVNRAVRISPHLHPFGDALSSM